MFRFNPMFLRMGTSAIVFNKPNDDGSATPPTDDQAAAAEAAKQAEEAQKLAAAEAVEAEAKAAAEKAKKDADGSDDPELKKLAEEKAELVREVMDKKNKLKSAQDSEKEAREKLALFGDVDPAKVQEMMKKEADAEKAALEAEGDFQRVKDMMAAEHKKETEAKDAEIAALKEAASATASTIDDLTVGASFGNSKFINENLILSPAKARALYGNRFGIEDGVTVAYDKPAGAKDRTILVDANGSALAFEVAMARIIDEDPDKDSMLRSKAVPGGRSKPAAPGDTKPKPKGDGLTGAARIAASIAAAEAKA